VTSLQAAGRAAEADWLRSDAESRGLVALAHLLDRDYAGAWECYRAMGTGEGAGQGTSPNGA
jgi:hypothetical protein